jgi:hypothetical protein
VSRANLADGIGAPKVRHKAQLSIHEELNDNALSRQKTAQPCTKEHIDNVELIAHSTRWQTNSASAD